MTKCVPYSQQLAYPIPLEAYFQVHNRWATSYATTTIRSRTRYGNPRPGTARNFVTGIEVKPSGLQGRFKSRFPNSRRRQKVIITTRCNRPQDITKADIPGKSSSRQLRRRHRTGTWNTLRKNTTSMIQQWMNPTPDRNKLRTKQPLTPKQMKIPYIFSKICNYKTSQSFPGPSSKEPIATATRITGS